MKEVFVARSLTLATARKRLLRGLRKRSPSSANFTWNLLIKANYESIFCLPLAGRELTSIARAAISKFADQIFITIIGDSC